MKKNVFFLIVTFLNVNVFCQLPKVYLGNIVRIDSFVSNYITARNIDIWLPQGYNSNKKYAVLYMNDGQMLFDSSITWNKQEWMVDETVSELISSKKIKKCIVVGIWNGGKTRHIDYFPQKPFETLSVNQQDSIYNTKRPNGQSVFNNQKIQSDNYLKFLVTELKPRIDSQFSTLKTSKNTFIAGSSMGGLISIYAICQYPNIFGGAACLSTHWPGIFTLQNNPIPNAFFDYLQKKLPNHKNHKIYFDYGTATLDTLYPLLQKKVDLLMVAKGFNAKHWLTKEFLGADHSEKSWQKRLNIPIEFLLKL